MASTYEMVDLINSLILADRKVTIEDIRQLGISLSTAHQIVYDDRAFLSLSFTKIMQGPILRQELWKLSVNLFVHNCFIFLTVKICSSLISICLAPSRNFSEDKVFNKWWNEEHRKQMAKNSVQRFLRWKNTNAGFSMVLKCVFKNEDYNEK